MNFIFYHEFFKKHVLVALVSRLFQRSESHSPGQSQRKKRKEKFHGLKVPAGHEVMERDVLLTQTQGSLKYHPGLNVMI